MGTVGNILYPEKFNSKRIRTTRHLKKNLKIYWKKVDTSNDLLECID